MTDIPMRILLSAVGGSSVTSAIQGIGSALSGGGGLGSALLGVGVAAAGLAVGLGVTAVQAAGDFQQAMLNLESHAGLASSQVDTVNQALMQMGPAVGKGPTELATALYPVLSGLSNITDQSAKTQIALTELNDAAKSVAGTSVDTTTVTNAATSAFNAFNMQSTDTATNISRMNNLFDVMNATVTAGNMQWGNYANKVGDLSAKAAQSHVSFTEANAALATFTNTGESVDLAGTHLGALFLKMGNDADTLAKHATKLHITFDETKFKALDLAGKIQYLDEVTGNDPGKIKAMLGNQTLAVTFQKLSDHAKDYGTTLDGLNHSQGATEQAFEKASSGFNFSMQKLQAAGQALFITIGEKLLPILTQFVNTAIIPAVNWINQLFSGTQSLGNNSGLTAFLEKVRQSLEQLQGAFQSFMTGLQPLIATMISIGHVLMSFFVQIAPYVVIIFAQIEAGVMRVYTAMLPSITQIAQAFLRLYVVLAPVIEKIVQFVAQSGIIPVIFTVIANVIGTIFTIIATVITTQINIVIAIIQTLVAIPGFLQGIWDAITDAVYTTFSAIGAFFSFTWNGITTGLRVAWSAIVAVIQGGITFVHSIITNAFNAIGTAFVWLYNHNYYFKALIDAITGVVKTGLAWLQSAWAISINWIINQWDNLVNFASDLWKKISDAIQIGFSAAITYVSAIWNSISSFFVNAWNAYVATPLATLWKNVSSVFSSAWNTYVVGPLSSLWNSINSWFGNLGNQALQWGKNLIQSFINGILSMLNNVGNAASQIASTVASFLGFHSPAKEGAGTELDQWPKNLIASYGKGLQAAIPQLQTSLNMVAQPIANTLGDQNIHPALPAPSPAGISTQQPIVFNISVSGVIGNKQDIVTWLEKELSNRLRRSGTLSTVTSGGKATY